MKLATLFQAYCPTDFDLETATESEVVVCDTQEAAVEWARRTIHEGREPTVEWQEENMESPSEWRRPLVVRFFTDCNEEGAPEESLLFVRDVAKV